MKEYFYSLLRRVSFLLLSIVIGNNLFAYDMELDGLLYNYIGYRSGNPLGGEVHLVGYSSNVPEDLIVPFQIQYENKLTKRKCQVTTITDGALMNCSKLKSVNTNGVLYIQNNVFKNCTSLKQAIIGSSAKSVGYSAFENCSSLKKVSLTGCSIGSKAFSGCTSLDTIDIGSSVPAIQDDTFDESAYQNAKVYIPDTELDYCKNHEIWGRFQNLITRHTVNIGVCGHGSVLYNGELLNSNPQTVIDGSSIDLTFVPEEGYQLATLIVDDADVTEQVVNNQYTIRNVTKSLNIIVSFHTVKLTVSGNGYVKCSRVNQWGTEYSTGEELRSETVTYYVGTESLVFYLRPDYGYKVDKVSKNGEDITARVTGVSNNTLSISADDKCPYDTYEIMFGKITHELTIDAKGNGAAIFNGNTVREDKKTFTVEEESSPVVLLQPDDGCRIKNVKLNGNNVSDIIDNQYTINNIMADTSLGVEFETIPYTLSISSKGNGAVSYNGTTIRDNTSSFTVLHGVSPVMVFTPDDGYRIKSVVLNNVDITSSVANSQYTINKVDVDYSMEVEFEAIPIFNLNIVSSGNGSVRYDGVTIRNQSRDFSIEGGSSIVLSLTPDTGCRIGLVRVNGIDVTGQISNGELIISNVSANTTVEVTFEAIPLTTYTLTITSSGNGVVMYDGINIRNSSQGYSVVEGTNATFVIIPDMGYRVKSVKLNNTDITASLTNNVYTINNINTHSSLQVEFEVITYNLSVKAIGNGSATYNETEIRNKTATFTVNHGSSAIVSFTPDTGYRIKRVKLNGTDVTADVSNNQYTISNITTDTSLEVEFEVIKLTLSINATGNGSATYNETEIRNKTATFTVNHGSSAIVSFTPDTGYRIKRVKLNGTDVTADVSNNQYTISNITTDTSLEVEFEVITYTLSIKATGDGVAIYDNNTVRGKTTTFAVNHGSAAIVSFTPDTGYRIKTVKVDDMDVTEKVTEGKYTISNITSDVALEVEFEAIPIYYTLSVKATGNGSVTYDGNSIRSNSNSFTVLEGTSVSLSIVPDNGFQLKMVLVNSQDVTADVKNNKYVISEMKGDISVEVTFERTYTLRILSTGNGIVSYGGTTIRNEERTFEPKEGTAISVTITPDEGYRLKSVIVNGQDVTAHVDDGQYTISELNDNTSIDVVFEAIPVYTFNMVVSGNGSVSYGNIVIRNQSQNYSLMEGSTVVITITPDNGYRVASVKLNKQDVTDLVENNLLTVTIMSNTSVEIAFEALPPTTYTLGITAIGNGVVTYDGNTIRDNISSFTVIEGTMVVLSITPDEGYRLKSIKVNGEDVTADVMNNRYTVGKINENTTVEVEFEAIPTYTLTISTSGSGQVEYNGTSICNQNKSFTLLEGSSATLSITPDAGYRIASILVNSTDVTSQVLNGQITISNIKENMAVVVVFEAIPPTTYTLSVGVSGNGSVTYDGKVIRGKTSEFTIIEGTTITLTFTADEGNRLKSVKLNNMDVTAAVVNNQYTINNVKASTTFEVVFEEIPPTIYSLNIVASGNGTVSYNGNVIRNQSREYSITEGNNVVVTLTPDNGYRVASVKVNSKDATGQITDGKLTIDNVSSNMNIEVAFEAIPPTTYTLTITANGNGSASYDSETIRDKSSSFVVVEGTYATITFTPDNDYRVKSVKVDGVDVTQGMVNNQYIVKVIADTELSVEFEEDLVLLTDADVNYKVVSYDLQTANVAEGTYGHVLTIPASFTAKGKTWNVIGVEVDALTNNTDLAAVIWNPEVTFNGCVSNPNLLIYVKATEYAPNEIRNVVVNGQANNITLTDAAGSNNFYCPQTFVANRITYEHNYSMRSGYKNCQGWETIALPYDVSAVISQTGTDIVPYSTWTVGSTKRPFWLYELTTEGWKAATAILANTPYIISMPNNENYDADYNITGKVVFTGTNVQVKASDELAIGTYGQKKLVPSFQRQEFADIYALNVNNEFVQNPDGNYLPGSTFLRNSRPVHPFEAYLTVEGSAARAIPIFEGNEDTGIGDALRMNNNEEVNNKVFNLNGQRVQAPSKGVYIVNGRKVVMK